jgi:C-methyltransferase
VTSRAPGRYAVAVPGRSGEEPPKSSPRVALLELSRAYVVSRAIHVAAELGVADQVGSVPVPVEHLAERTGVDAARLTRLLRLLAAHRVFAEVEPGSFVATPMSDAMRDDAAQSLRPALRMVTPSWWMALGDLGQAVLTGEPSFRRVLGEEFFSYLRRHPDEQRRFDEGMAANSATSDRTIASAYDFASASTVVDLGGGRGGLLSAILELHPQIRGILFDQPNVVAKSQLALDPAIANRCEMVGGDLFMTVPSGADVYVIRGVLHDFDDGQCVGLLDVCRRAMGSAGRLLVVERSSIPDNRPHEAKTIDVLMMALLGGRERTRFDWERLLSSAQLRLRSEIPTESEFTIFEAVST